MLHGLQPGLFAPAADNATATAAAKEMCRLLEALAANLAAEQRELARQDFVLFRQLLTPIQVGLLPSVECSSFRGRPVAFSWASLASEQREFTRWSASCWRQSRRIRCNDPMYPAFFALLW